MIEVSSHVPYKGRIDDLWASVVFCQAEHVAAKVKFLLSDICHGLANHFTDVFCHNCTFFRVFVDEEAQSVNLGRSNIDIISGFLHDKYLFFFRSNHISFIEIFFDIFKGDIRFHLRFN